MSVRRCYTIAITVVIRLGTFFTFVLVTVVVPNSFGRFRHFVMLSWACLMPVATLVLIREELWWILRIETIYGTIGIRVGLISLWIYDNATGWYARQTGDSPHYRLTARFRRA